MCGMFSPVVKKDTGATKVAKDLVKLCQQTPKVKYTYQLTDKLEDKIAKIAATVYGIKKSNIVYSYILCICS